MGSLKILKYIYNTYFANSNKKNYQKFLLISHFFNPSNYFLMTTYLIKLNPFSWGSISISLF